MPPCLDIYALTSERSRALIEQFLLRYGLYPDPYAGGHTSSDEGDSPAALIERMTSDPAPSGTAYLDSADPRISGLVLRATRDGRLILGLSIDEPDNWTDKAVAKPGRARAARLLKELVGSFPCTSAGAIAEWPPPNDWREFEQDLASTYAVVTWQAQQTE
jgi:hypothetical protein